MSTRRLAGLLAGGGLTALLCVATLGAGEPPKNATHKAATPAAQEPKEVTLEGSVVDLQCFMSGKYSMPDHAKCTEECLRNGVPAALETKTGLVIIGEGGRGPGAKLAPFAMTNVKLTGRIFEKSGIKYIDMTKVEKVLAQPHASAASPKKEIHARPQPAGKRS